MNSDRFFPSLSAARSIRARFSLSARRLIVTPRPARSAVSVLGIACLLYIQPLYRSVCTVSTHHPARRNLAHRSHGADVRPKGLAAGLFTILEAVKGPKSGITCQWGTPR